ncbi:adenylate/guanylate cyclase domain-containing protein [Candidatus Woesearchaeota archaeon]|nr:adenylate/guanylate cyclase domain-containing protein [Candidatus Woesearchaeota archaeon]
MAENKTEMLTIMFIDIVNYTETTGKLSRESFSRLHDTFDNLIIKAVSNFNGQIIKKIGDAFLITFRAATDAVHCGILLQKEFYQYNENNSRVIPLNIRVAIHAGEVLLRNRDIYGEAVNITSRIESIVKTGDIVFSEAVFSAMNKNEIPYKYIGSFKFKGVKMPIRLFKVKSREDFMREAKLIKIRKRIKMRRKLRAIVIFISVIFVILLLLSVLAKDLNIF